MKKDTQGCWLKGKFIPVWGGVYTESSCNESFIRGALPGLSRTIKATQHDAGVCVEFYEEDNTP